MPAAMDSITSTDLNFFPSSFHDMVSVSASILRVLVVVLVSSTIRKCFRWHVVNLFLVLDLISYSWEDVLSPSLQFARWNSLRNRSMKLFS